MNPKFAKSKSPTLPQPQNSHFFSIYIGHNEYVLSKNYIYQLGIYPPIPEPEEKTICCDANVHCNQKCLRDNIIPKFAEIKIPNTSPASKFALFLYVCILEYNGDVLCKNTARKF